MRLTEDRWNNNYEKGYTPWRREKVDLSHMLEIADIHSGTALDLGCGTGEVAIWLAENSFDVEALDFSKKALEIARGQSEKPDFVKWDLEELDKYDFRHEKYDLIIDSKVLPFIQDKKSYLDTIKEKLSGVFILNVIVKHDEDKRICINEDLLMSFIKPRFSIKKTEEAPTREGKKIMNFYLKLKN